MVERLAAGLGRFDKDAQIVAQLMLADEFIEGGRPHRAFCSVLVLLLRGDDTRRGVFHRASSSSPAFISTLAAASLPSRRDAAAIAPSASLRPTPTFSSAAIASAVAAPPVAASSRIAPDRAENRAPT